jgi:hypothetical protein
VTGSGEPSSGLARLHASLFVGLICLLATVVAVGRTVEAAMEPRVVEQQEFSVIGIQVRTNNAKGRDQLRKLSRRNGSGSTVWTITNSSAELGPTRRTSNFMTSEARTRRIRKLTCTLASSNPVSSNLVSNGLSRSSISSLSVLFDVLDQRFAGACRSNS